MRSRGELSNVVVSRDTRHVTVTAGRPDALETKLRVKDEEVNRLLRLVSAHENEATELRERIARLEDAVEGPLGHEEIIVQLRKELVEAKQLQNALHLQNDHLEHSLKDADRRWEEKQVEVEGLIRRMTELETELKQKARTVIDRENQLRQYTEATPLRSGSNSSSRTTTTSSVSFTYSRGGTSPSALALPTTTDQQHITTKENQERHADLLRLQREVMELKDTLLRERETNERTVGALKKELGTPKTEHQQAKLQAELIESLEKKIESHKAAAEEAKQELKNQERKIEEQANTVLELQNAVAQAQQEWAVQQRYSPNYKAPPAATPPPRELEVSERELRRVVALLAEKEHETVMHLRKIAELETLMKKKSERDWTVEKNLDRARAELQRERSAMEIELSRLVSALAEREADLVLTKQQVGELELLLKTQAGQLEMYKSRSPLVVPQQPSELHQEVHILQECLRTSHQVEDTLHYKIAALTDQLERRPLVMKPGSGASPPTSPSRIPLSVCNSPNKDPLINLFRRELQNVADSRGREVNRLITALTETQKEGDELRASLAASQDELGAAHDALIRERTTARDLERRLASFSSSCSPLVDTFSHPSLAAELQELRTAAHVADNLATERGAEVGRLLRVIAELEAAVKEAEMDCKSIHGSIQQGDMEIQLRTSNELLTEKLHKSNDDWARLCAAIGVAGVCCVDEIISVYNKGSVDSQQLSAFQDNINDKDAIIAEQSKSISVLEARLDELRTSLSASGGNISPIKISHSSNKTYDLVDLSDSLSMEQCTEMIGKLQRQLCEADNSKRERERDHTADIDQLKVRTDLLEGERNQLRKRCEELVADISRENQHVGDNNFKIKELERELDRYKAFDKDQRSRISMITTELDDTKRKCFQHEDAETRLRHQVSVLQQDCNHSRQLQESLFKEESDRRQARHECDQMTSELSLLRRRVTELEKAEVDVSETKAKLVEFDHIITKLAVTEADKRRIEQRMAELELSNSELGDAEKDLIDTKRTLEIKLVELDHSTDKVRQLERKSRESELELSSCNQRITDLMRLEIELKDTSEALQNLKEKTRDFDKFSKAYPKLQTTIEQNATLELQLLNFTNDLRESVTERDFLREKISILQKSNTDHDKLQGDLSSAHQELQRELAKCEVLEAEKTALNRQLHQYQHLEDELKHAQEENAVILQKTKELEEALDVANQKQETLEQEIDVKCAKADGLQQEANRAHMLEVQKKQLERRISELEYVEGGIKTAEGRVCELQRAVVTMEALQIEKDALERRVAKLEPVENQLTAAEARIYSMEAEKKARDKQIGSVAQITEELHHANSKIHNLERDSRQLEILKADNDTLRKRVDHLELIETQLKDATQQIQVLEEDVQQLQSEVNRLQEIDAKVQQFKDKINEMEPFMQQAKNLEKQNNDLQLKVAELTIVEEAAKTWQSKLIEFENELKVAQRNNAGIPHLESTLQQKDTIILDLQSELDGLLNVKAENRNLQQQLHEMDRLKQRLEKKNSQIHQLENEHHELQERLVLLEPLKESVKKQEAEIVELNRHACNLAEDKESLVRQVDDLRTVKVQLSEAQIKIDRLEAERHDTSVQWNEFEQILKEKDATLSVLEHEISQIPKLKTETSDMDQLITDLRAQLTSVEDKLNMTEGDRRNLQQQLHDMDALKERLSQRETVISTLQTSLDQSVLVESQKRTLENEAKDLQFKINRLQQQLLVETQHTDLQKNECDSLAAEIANLREVNYKKQIENLNLADASQRMERAAKEHQNKTESLQQEIKRLMDEKRDLKQSISELDEKIYSQQQSIAQLNNANAIAEEEVKSLHKQITATEVKYCESLGVHRELQSINRELHDKVCDANSKVEDMEEVVNSREVNIDKLNKTIATLKDTVESRELALKRAHEDVDEAEQNSKMVEGREAEALDKLAEAEGQLRKNSIDIIALESLLQENDAVLQQKICEAEELHHVMSSKGALLQQLSDQLHIAQDSIIKAEKTLEHSELENGMLQREVKECQQQLEQLSHQSSSQAKALHDRETQLSKSKEALLRAEGRQEELQDRLIETERDIDDLRSATKVQHEAATAKSQRLESMLRDATEDVRRYKQDYDRLEAAFRENKKARRAEQLHRKAEARGDMLWERVKEAENKLEEANARMWEAEEREKRGNRQMALLHKKMKEIEERLIELQQDDNRMEDAKRELELRDRLRDAEEKLDVATLSVTTTEARLKEAEVRLDESRTREMLLRDELKDLERTSIDVHSQIAETTEAREHAERRALLTTDAERRVEEAYQAHTTVTDALEREAHLLRDANARSLQLADRVRDLEQRLEDEHEKLWIIEEEQKNRDMVDPQELWDLQQQLKQAEDGRLLLESRLRSTEERLEAAEESERELKLENFAHSRRIQDSVDEAKYAQTREEQMRVRLSDTEEKSKVSFATVHKQVTKLEQQLHQLESDRRVHEQLLREAEHKAREAENRCRESERLIEELGPLKEMEDRARVAQVNLLELEKRSKKAEETLRRDFEQRLRECELKYKTSEESRTTLHGRCTELEQQLRSANEGCRAADYRARAAMDRQRDAEDRARQIHTKLSDVDRDATDLKWKLEHANKIINQLEDTEQRLHDSMERQRGQADIIKEHNRKTLELSRTNQDLEERLRSVENSKKKSLDRLLDTEEKMREAEDKQRATERELRMLQDSADRARAIEVRLNDAERRAREAETQERSSSEQLTEIESRAKLAQEAQKVTEEALLQSQKSLHSLEDELLEANRNAENTVRQIDALKQSQADELADMSTKCDLQVKEIELTLTAAETKLDDMTEQLEHEKLRAMKDADFALQVQDSLEQRARDAEAMYRDSQQTVQEVEMKMKGLEAQLVQCNAQHTELQAQHAELQRIHQDTVEKLDEATTSTKEWEQRAADAETQAGTIEKRLRKLERDFEEQMQAIQEQARESDRELRITRDKLSEAEEQTPRKLAEAALRESQLKEILQDVQHKSQEKDGAVETLKGKVDHLQTKLQSTELELLETTSPKKLDALKKREEQLKEDLETTERQLVDVEDEARLSKRDLKRHQTELKDKELVIRELVAKVKVLEDDNRWDDCKKREAILEARLNEAEASLEEQKVHEKDMEARLKEVIRVAAVDAEERVLDAERQVQQAQERATKLRDKLSEAQSQLEDANSRAWEAEVLAGKSKDYREKVEKLERQLQEATDQVWEQQEKAKKAVQAEEHRLKELEMNKQDAQAREDRLKDRLKLAEDKVKQSNTNMWDTEAKMKEVEQRASKQLREAEEKLQDSMTKVWEAEQAVKDAEHREQQTERQLKALDWTEQTAEEMEDKMKRLKEKEQRLEEIQESCKKREEYIHKQIELMQLRVNDSVIDGLEKDQEIERLQVQQHEQADFCDIEVQYYQSLLATLEDRRGNLQSELDSLQSASITQSILSSELQENQEEMKNNTNKLEDDIMDLKSDLLEKNLATTALEDELESLQDNYTKAQQRIDQLEALLVQKDMMTEARALAEDEQEALAGFSLKLACQKKDVELANLTAQVEQLQAENENLAGSLQSSTNRESLLNSELEELHRTLKGCDTDRTVVEQLRMDENSAQQTVVKDMQAEISRLNELIAENEVGKAVEGVTVGLLNEQLSKLQKNLDEQRHTAERARHSAEEQARQAVEETRKEMLTQVKDGLQAQLDAVQSVTEYKQKVERLQTLLQLAKERTDKVTADNKNEIVTLKKRNEKLHHKLHTTTARLKQIESVVDSADTANSLLQAKIERSEATMADLLQQLADIGAQPRVNLDYSSTSFYSSSDFGEEPNQRTGVPMKAVPPPTTTSRTKLQTTTTVDKQIIRRKYNGRSNSQPPPKIHRWNVQDNNKELHKSVGPSNRREGDAIHHDELVRGRQRDRRIRTEQDNTIHSHSNGKHSTRTARGDDKPHSRSRDRDTYPITHKGTTTRDSHSNVERLVSDLHTEAMIRKRHTDRIKDLQNRLEAIERDADTAHAELNELSPAGRVPSNSKDRDRMASLRSTMLRLEDEKGDILDCISSDRKQVFASEDKIECLQLELGQAKDQDKELEMERYANEADRYKKDLERAKKTIRDLEKKLASTEKARGRAMNEIYQLQSSVVQHGQDSLTLVRLQKELKDKQTVINDLKTKLDAVLDKHHYSPTTEEYTRQLHQANMMLEEMRKQMVAAEEHSTALTYKYEKTLADLQNEKAEKEKLRSKLAQLVVEHEKKDKELTEVMLVYTPPKRVLRTPPHPRGRSFLSDVPITSSPPSPLLCESPVTPPPASPPPPQSPSRAPLTQTE